MMGVIELFGVEWVGDKDPVLFQLAPLLGSLFVAVAAAYAARLAAKTASSRHREQLEYDAERQREQLEHDTERQREELAYDREVRKQDYARDAVDSAIELVGEVQDVTANAIGGVEWKERRRTELEAELSEDDMPEVQRQKAAKKVVDHELALRSELIDAGRKVLEMYAATVRLKLRLGSDHPIPQKLNALMDAWEEVIDSVDDSPDRNRTSEEIAETQTAEEKASEYYSALMVECEQWLR